MSRKKMNNEEKQVARQKRYDLTAQVLHIKRQKRLEALFKQGASHVKICECGKYFDTTITGAVKNNFQYAKRSRCVKCPLRPLFFERKVFNKTLQEFVIVRAKNKTGKI